MGEWARNQLLASAAYVGRCPTTTGGAHLRAAPDCAGIHTLGGLYDTSMPS